MHFGIYYFFGLPPVDTNMFLFPHRLEERRKVKGAAYYERKKAARRQLLQAQRTASVDNKTKEQLAQYGY